MKNSLLDYVPMYFRSRWPLKRFYWQPEEIEDAKLMAEEYDWAFEDQEGMRKVIEAKIGAEPMLADLLSAGVLFCNERDYLWNGEKAGASIILFVICNDLFVWGSADAEDLPLSELKNLYRMWKKDMTWGSDKWCCKRRNLQPQEPVIEKMKAQGAWEKWMDELPSN